jgi:glycosyltransferase involved in cell wall biosynthesis
MAVVRPERHVLMPTILHIAADFPDAWSARKTRAVQNLVTGTAGFDHQVYSINRLNRPGGVHAVDRSDGHVTLTYGAPPFGILLETFLNPLADWIFRDVRSRGVAVDAVHAHKLTIEGLAARRLARRLGCPYVCTVRGNTDQKYLRAKPEKIGSYRTLLRDAAAVLTTTPWIERYLEAKLGLPPGRCELLPTITESDSFMSPVPGNGRLATAFHLNAWRLKGMPNLLAALRRLEDEGAGLALDVIGGGSEADTAALRGAIDRHRLSGRVILRGPVEHARMQEALNGYSGFVLPTLRETFGMVYLEALFSGVPILYSRDRGIDGFFDGLEVGVRCDPASPGDIARGLLAIEKGEASMKQAIARAQREGFFDRFRKGHVRARYRAIMERVCAQGAERRAPGMVNDTAEAFS